MKRDKVLALLLSIFMFFAVITYPIVFCMVLFDSVFYFKILLANSTLMIMAAISRGVYRELTD
jgi:hypothetical protein